jgi:hypothetical protein
MPEDDPYRWELMLNRFRRLIAEVIRGAVQRNAFDPWEIGILLDIQACGVTPKRLPKTLRAYLKVVEHQLQSGPGPPMKLSEFLQRRTTRRPETANAPSSTIRTASE